MKVPEEKIALSQESLLGAYLMVCHFLTKIKHYGRVRTYHEQHIASCRSRLESQWETPNFDSPWSQNQWGDRVETC